MSVLLLGFNTDAVDAANLDKIAALVPDMRVVTSRDRDEIEALLPEIEIVAGGLSPDLVVRAPALRWYQQWGAGADWLLKHPEATTKDFILTNASGVHTIQISEHIMGLCMMLGRRMQEAVRAQVRHEWWSAPGETMVELAGRTMLLDRCRCDWRLYRTACVGVRYACRGYPPRPVTRRRRRRRHVWQ